MIYVIQVIGGQEAKVKKELLFLVSRQGKQDEVKDVFYPTRERRYKINKVWETKTEKLFPGYLFVESSDPIDLFALVKEIPDFTRLLAITSIYKEKKLNFLPLSEEEEQCVNRLCSSRSDHLTPLSQVRIKEGSEVEIVRGPLLGLKSQVVKIDLHKRTATIRIEMLGQYVNTIVGIDILQSVDDEIKVGISKEDDEKKKTKEQH